jgi:hypothetical protein
MPHGEALAGTGTIATATTLRRHQKFMQRPEAVVAQELLKLVGGEDLLGKFRDAAYTYSARARSEFFTMVFHGHLAEAVRRIDETTHPHLNLRAFVHLLEYVEPETGKILIDYKQLAELLGCQESNASRAMNELARQHLLLRFQRGRKPTYHWNANLAWVGPIELRKKAAETAPQLAMPI